MSAAPPQLSGQAADAVNHRGSHLQIIAAAGSGKTEVVSQRVASLLADGVEARGIVAFTFTEKAAAELKERIARRVEQRMGHEGLDRLTGLFVGTIHAYCFRLLQQYVPRYETYDVMDQNQQTAFLSREANRLELKQFDPAGRNRLFASVEVFARSVDIVENELIPVKWLPDPFRSAVAAYYDTLERYRLLTYGLQIVKAVEELSRPEIAERIHADLRHLIVDEYQDVNPSQERLISLLASGGAELCVVGDDDQAVYQWRGSDVANIVDFQNRYPTATAYSITTNRRSRQQIIEVANTFAQTIPNRLDKTMDADRHGATPQVVLWTAEDEVAEAGWIAQMIDRLHDDGVAYNDIGVLVRTRAAYRALLDAFGTFGIPVQPGGRTGLFEQPEAKLLGQTYCWLVDFDWRDASWGQGAVPKKDDLIVEYTKLFGLDGRGRTDLSRLLDQWKAVVPKEKRSSDLVGDYYELLDVLGVREIDLDDPIGQNTVGTLARFSNLLTDYETVRRRARPDGNAPGEQVGGQDRGEWYYRFLAIHLVNYANGAYEAFDGEPEVNVDAVAVSTVHGAKGLEWPVAFVPSMTAGRFPGRKVGSIPSVLVPETLFDINRYAGSDADERRLFYVAITRARDFLSVSRHERIKNRVKPSPYFQELDFLEVLPDDVAPSSIEPRRGGDEAALELTYSELAAYLDCAAAYRLRNRYGFQPRLAPELGYGKAVHHVLRTVAETTQVAGSVPDAAELARILDESFFLPTANKVAHRAMKEAARRLIGDYIDGPQRADLFRVWQTERPFELRLPGVTVKGRADVILDKEGGVETAMAIVDYKTSTDSSQRTHDLQLQVYANAGRREGLDVRAAYVHDLSEVRSIPISVGTAELAAAEQEVLGAATRLRARDFSPNPEKARCRRCEVRTICKSAK